VTDLAAPRWRDLLTPTLAPRAALVILGVWLNAADALVTITIMPSVARDLGGAAYYGWAIAGFLTGSILAGASAGQLSRRLGLRPAMILAALVYAGGCVLSAAAPSIHLFLLGRVLQGVGSGWIVGFCYVAIGMVFPQRLWPLLFGGLSGVWGVASVLGPFIGGVFGGTGLWRGAFWLFAGQGLLFALACAVLLKRERPPDEHRPLAWKTLGVLTLAIAAIAAADLTSGVLAPVGLLIGGALLFALASRINAWPGERLLPVNAFRPSTLAGAGYALIFAMEVATVVQNVYQAAILQTAYGLTPLLAGYVVCSLAVGWTVAAFVVARQPPARQGTMIVSGATVIVLGTALTAFTLGRAPLAWVVAAGIVTGTGFGMSWSFTNQRILTALPETERDIGAGAVPTTQLVGGAVGAAAAGAVANLLRLPQEFTLAHIQAVTPWLFGAFLPVALLGWLAALRLARS